MKNKKHQHKATEKNTIYTTDTLNPSITRLTINCECGETINLKSIKIK